MARTGNSAAEGDAVPGAGRGARGASAEGGGGRGDVVPGSEGSARPLLTVAVASWTGGGEVNGNNNKNCN